MIAPWQILELSPITTFGYNTIPSAKSAVGDIITYGWIKFANLKFKARISSFTIRCLILVLIKGQQA